jgi:hypothetical protein
VSGLWAPAVSFRLIDAGVGFGCSLENAIPGANRLTSRRRSKNSGGGIAPAANGGLIEGAACSVNVSGWLRNPKIRPGSPDKLLMRLNLPVPPGKA